MSVPQALVGGRYRLIEVIAHGGMGVVWRARDERLDRPVAVKQLRTHPGITEREAEIAKNRAIREAHITAQLDHPHAVPVLDAVEHEGQPCLVMPYLPSTPLSAVLRKRTALPLRDVIRIGAQAASALAAAHRLRIVHRDVKPGNVLITRDGTAHISDFGISHALGDATLTDTGFLHGTPAYLSPEVARGGSATFASDVFSLGSTLYAALEGAPPFGSDPNPIALLHRVAAARVEPPTHAGDLGPLLLQMLSEEPRDRPKMDVVAASLADLKARGAAAERTRPVATPRATAQQSSAAALSTWFPSAQDAPTGPVDEGATAAASTSLSPAAGAAPSPAEPVGASSVGASSVGASSVGASSVGAATRGQSGTRRRALVGLGSVAALVVAVLVLANVTDDSSQDVPETAGDRVVLPTSSPATSDATPSPSSSAAEVAAPTSDATSPPPTSDPVAAAPSPAPSPTPEPEPSPEPSPEPAVEPSMPEPVTQAQPSPLTEQSPSTSQDRAAELSSAVTDYYSLIPNDTDAAWPRMTADYQSNHAGGRAAYDSFWGKVDAISVSDVQPAPPNRARATLTYSFSDGRTVVERTAYRFVDDGGSLRIAASDVLSSTTIG